MLETDRLVLREFAAEDFDAVHAYASDPEVVAYMPWGPNTEQDTTDFLERARGYRDVDPRADFVMAVQRRSDARVIGGIGLHLHPPDAHQAMLGYCYASEAWGKGFATEAALELVAFGFDLIGVHRIWAGCDPDNTASIRVLEKLGMSLEGRLREDSRIRGRVRDTLVFGVLEREYRNR